jgi:transposase InsO family protein
MGTPNIEITLSTSLLATVVAGNRYLLVVGDYFSKWSEAIAIRDQEAITVANKLVDIIISILDVPMEIHSDQGSNFESQVFKEMCKLLDLHKTRTTSLRPQSDGMVERFNATIENMLASFESENQKDWGPLQFRI